MCQQKFKEQMSENICLVINVFMVAHDFSHISIIRMDSFVFSFKFPYYFKISDKDTQLGFFNYSFLLVSPLS